MDKEIAEAFEKLNKNLEVHAQEARDRERRSVARDKNLSERVESLSADVRKAQETADLAHAVALEAKHHANRVEMGSEAEGMNVLAELGSVKVVCNGVTKAVEDATKAITLIEKERAEEKKREKETSEKERRLDAKARKFWRVAQPTIIAVVLAILSQFTNILTPASKMPSVQSVQDAGQ